MNLTLKITPHLVPILKLISENAEVVVSAPTGTGKSLGIPWAVAKTGARIFVSVPTVTAALSLYETQKKLSSNVKIGFAAEGKVFYDENTKIVYATSGHMRKKMLSYVREGLCMPLDFTDVLMIDEVHTGSADNDIILALWNYCRLGNPVITEQNKKVQVPRLIYSSAVIPESLLNSNVKIYTVPDKNYPIQIRYHNKDYEVDDSSLYSDLAKLISEYHTSSVEGGFLVFLPGANEVETVMKLLSNLSNVLILPAYSSLSGEDISKIYESVPDGKVGGQIEPKLRKIIVATNIAETAITIENIGVVFDSMREKRAETSLNGGFRLTTSLISKASGTQRCGRTGRTRAGICYRMITENGYKNLEETRPSELDSIPIHTITMELLNVGIRPSKLLKQITKAREEFTLDLLRMLNMVDDKGVTTEIGRFATMFPLSVRNSVALYHWLYSGVVEVGEDKVEEEKEILREPFPAIVTLAMIDSYGPPYFWFPKKERNMIATDYNELVELHREQYFDKYKGKTEIDTFLNIFNDMIEEIGYFGADIKDYCVKNSLNNKKMREMINIVRQSINTVERINQQKTRNKKLKLNKGKIDRGIINVERTINELRPILEKCYADLILERVETSSVRIQYRSINNKKVVYTLDTQKTLNMLENIQPKRLLGILTTEISTGNNFSFNILNLAIDISSGVGEKYNLNADPYLLRILDKPKATKEEYTVDDLPPSNIVIEVPESIDRINDRTITTRIGGISSLQTLGQTSNLENNLGVVGNRRNESLVETIEEDRQIPLLQVIRSKVNYIAVN